MGYPKAVFDMAEKIMSDRRSECKSTLTFRRKKIFSEIPEAEVLENRIASLPMAAVRSVLNGKFNKEELETCRKESLILQDELKSLLLSHGYAENALEESFNCEKCNDTGYIDGKMCSCMRELLKKTACDYLNSFSSMTPCRFEDFSLEYYSDKPLSDGATSPRRKMEKIFEYCKNYAADFCENSNNIFMQGATGLGKTHLSRAIALEVTNRGFGVIYCSTPDIARQLEKEYFTKFDSKETSTEQLLLESDLLIIDDLGTEFINKYSISSLYNIVNTRVMKNRPTIINTNFSIQELHEIYGMRFISRIIGEFDRLDFVGSDIRQIKKKRK